jgi:small-conductance mechanosensitive channel
MAVADSFFGVATIPHFAGALGFAVGGIGIWQSGRVANWVRDGVLRSTEVDHELAPFARQMTRLVCILVSIGIGMVVAGVGTGGLVAFVSASGLGLTLALQSMLLNMASGVALLMFRPFKSNDEIEAAGVQGRVQAIKLMSTELRTADNVHVSLPNSKVWGAEIRNFTKQPLRRLDTLVPVPHAVDAAAALEVLLEVAKRIQAAALAGPLQAALEDDPASHPPRYDGASVAVQEMREAATVLRVRVWCRSSEVDETRTRLLTEVRGVLPELPGWRTVAPTPESVERR